MQQVTRALPSPLPKGYNPLTQPPDDGVNGPSLTAIDGRRSGQNGGGQKISSWDYPYPCSSETWDIAESCFHAEFRLTSSF